MKLSCRLFGCDFRYNFVSLPNKCICKKCRAKWKWNLNINNGWEKVDSFNSDLGTDEEIIKRWNERK